MAMGAAGRNKKGFLGSVGKYILIAVLIGLFIAVLRIFNNNPIALFDWVWRWAVHIVGAISDWFSTQEWFHNIFRKPQ